MLHGSRKFYLICALFVLNGCSSGNLPQTNQVTQEDERLLVHDFGIIRPRSEQTHIFALKNPTDEAWKVHRIIENCACTGVKTSADVVPAGSSLDVELTYRAGTGFTDDRRDTVVEFEQEGVLAITLRVEAQIRPQIVLRPSHVSFSAYEPDKQYQDTIVVHDWSDDGLKTVEFRSDDPWIAVSAPSKDRSTDTKAQFSPWTATVVADTKGLPPGKHSGRVEVIAQERGLEYSTYLTVSLDVTPPVRIVPSDLFFGEVKPSETAAIRSTLFVVPGSAVGTEKSLWESMAVSSDFPADILSVEITKETEARGTMTVSLTPKTTERLKGNVTVKFGDGRFHELSLPVIASVRSETLSPSKKENDDENLE